MKSKHARYRLLPTLLLIAATAPLVYAQQTQKPSDDVIKVNTDLVQTSVTVVDKEGRFVDSLARESFQLLIDGKPRPISLFDRITAGKPRPAELSTPTTTIDPGSPKLAA